MSIAQRHLPDKRHYRDESGKRAAMIVVVHKSVMSMSERERERAELSNGNHEWAPRKFGIDMLATRPRRRLGLCHKSNCKRTSDESKEGGFDHMPKRSSRETRSVRSREKTTRNERDWRGCMKRIGDTKKVPRQTSCAALHVRACVRRVSKRDLVVSTSLAVKGVRTNLVRRVGLVDMGFISGKANVVVVGFGVRACAPARCGNMSRKSVSVGRVCVMWWVEEEGDDHKVELRAGWTAH